VRLNPVKPFGVNGVVYAYGNVIYVHNCCFEAKIRLIIGVYEKMEFSEFSLVLDTPAGGPGRYYRNNLKPKHQKNLCESVVKKISINIITPQLPEFLSGFNKINTVLVIKNNGFVMFFSQFCIV
jgi:hypothetical protein